MPERLEELVKKKYEIVDEAPRKLTKNELNEEWTKQNIILPLLEELGWDSAFEIHPESQPDGTEGWIDYLLKPQAPQIPSLCVEAKALQISAPEDRYHNYIVKGIEQTEQREASYFIWTNGDSWQIYALTLPYAPMYEIRLSTTRGIEEQIKRAADQFQILEKDKFI